MNSKPIISTCYYIVTIAICLFLFSCKEKEVVEPIAIVKIINTTANDADETTVKVHSSFVVDGGTIALKYFGFVFGKNPGVNVSSGTTTTEFPQGTVVQTSTQTITDTLINLERNTTYFVKAYVKRENGLVEYGDEVSFTTLKGNRWLEIFSSFPGTFSYGVLGSLIGNEFYMAGGVQYVSKIGEKDIPNEEVYKYDIKNGKWTRLADYPGTYSSGKSFAIGQKLYLINTSRQTWEYDIALNRWARKVDFPSTEPLPAISFSVGNIGYAGIGYTTTQNTHSFLAFDPIDISNGVDEFGNPKGKWTSKADFPGFSHFRDVAFTANSKGYVLHGGEFGLLYEYNPTNNEWLLITAYPGTLPDANGGHLNAFAFVIGDKAYISAGTDSNNPAEIWIYNFTTPQWSELQADNELLSAGWGTSFGFENEGYLFSDGVFEKFIP